jgi:hypothetical protein
MGGLPVMRYYELDENGKIKGTYAVPQLDKTLHLLEDPPGENYYRDGVPGYNWLPDLDAIKAKQVIELKTNMRILLSLAIGDYGDNIADVTRALVLSEGIRSGTITDQKIIDGYTAYCNAMIEMYGGAQAILDVLNTDLQGLQTYLAPYYIGKDEVSSAVDVQSVKAVLK